VCTLPVVPALSAQARLTLADAVSEALAGNPQVATAAARVAVAEGLRVQAGMAPNPRLILQSENTRFYGSPPFLYPRDADSYAFLAQVIETGGSARDGSSWQLRMSAAANWSSSSSGNR
jgi:outer membrane protein, heavy metal efflux system